MPDTGYPQPTLVASSVTADASADADDAYDADDADDRAFAEAFDAKARMRPDVPAVQDTALPGPDLSADAWSDGVKERAAAQDADAPSTHASAAVVLENGIADLSGEQVAQASLAAGFMDAYAAASAEIDADDDDDLLIPVARGSGLSIPAYPVEPVDLPAEIAESAVPAPVAAPALIAGTDLHAGDAAAIVGAVQAKSAPDDLSVPTGNAVPEVAAQTAVVAPAVDPAGGLVDDLAVDVVADLAAEITVDANGQAEGLADEATVRDVIRELIQEELHGELGQRFSRNLRAVIRREVAAAIDDHLERL